MEIRLLAEQPKLTLDQLFENAPKIEGLGALTSTERRYKTKDEYIFYDCSPESPGGRRSLCYDQKALESRKEHKPKNSVMNLATEMGVELLTEQQYRDLQKIGEFDKKTSSWVETPAEIRKLGGAIFCDRRYNTVFTYHNGAESYYASRGFRASLKV